MGIVFLMILGLFGCHAKTEETAGVGKKTTEKEENKKWNRTAETRGAASKNR
ncbi:MAG: hypothetical protein ACLTDX_06250 [[Clostridium] innocuum]